MTAQSGLGFSGIVAIQIPDDGATGEVLTKVTNDDYDYDWQPGGGGGGAPTGAEYVVMTLHGALPNERVLTAGTGINVVDGGAGGPVTISVNPATAGIDLQAAYDADTTVPQIVVNGTPDPVTIDASVAGDIFAVRDSAANDLVRMSDVLTEFTTAPVQMNDILSNGNLLALTLNETYTQSAAFIGGAISSQGTITFTNATWIWALLAENKTYREGVAPGFAAFTLFNALARIENFGNFNLVQALVLNNGVTHARVSAGTSTVIQTRGLSNSPGMRTDVAGAVLTKTGGDTAVTHAPNYGTVAGSTVNFGTSRGLHCMNIAAGLFQPSAGVETLTAYVGFEMDAITFGGNVTKRAMRSALTAATNTLMIENTGGAASDFGTGILHFDDTTPIQFGGTAVNSQDVSIFWSGAGNYFSMFFTAFSDELRFSNPANTRLLIQGNAGIGAAGDEFNIACARFSMGAQTGAVGNQVGNFVAGARTIGVAGEWSDFLLTQAANVDVNGLAMSLVAGWTINAPSITLSGGSVTTAAALNIGGNPGSATNRVGVRILSNPSGGAGVNAALWITAGRARFDGIVDINNGIALGGGAAATLGTIGGAGPTTAAQAQWLQIEIGGVNHWIPVWT